jgi:predicted ester cyclase
MAKLSSPDALMRQWFQEVWNERREEAIDRLMAPDARVHGLAESPIVGPTAFKPFHKSLCAAFGHFNVDVAQTVVEGDRVVALCHVTGCHDGDGLGCKGTGNNVDFWGMTMARVVDGRLVEGWNTFVFLTMYQQVGVVKSPVV